MSRSIRKISRYFKRQLEARFNPLFRSNIECGVIVDIDKGFDVDYVDSLSSFGVVMPEVFEGVAHLPELSSMGGLKLSGSAALQLPAALPLPAEVDVAIKSSRNISLSFGKAKMQFVKRFRMEQAIRAALQGNDGDALKDYLADHDHQIVMCTYNANVNIHFSAKGGVSLDGKALLPNIGNTQGGIEWKWSDKSTLTSSESVTFAFETADWRRKAQRLKETS